MELKHALGMLLAQNAILAKNKLKIHKQLCSTGKDLVFSESVYKELRKNNSTKIWIGKNWLTLRQFSKKCQKSAKQKIGEILVSSHGLSHMVFFWGTNTRWP